MKISRLLYNEAKWTKGCLGRTKEGKAVNNFDIIHKDGHELDPTRNVESYSLYGAIAKLYNGEGQSDIAFKLGDVIRKYKGQRIYLAQFNDDPTTTYEDIMEILKIANL